MNDTICPVIFRKIEDQSKSKKQIEILKAKNKKYLNAVLSGQNPAKSPKPAGKDVIFKKCKIIFGQAANEIIIKSILPDDRGIDQKSIESDMRESVKRYMRKKLSDDGFKECEIKSKIKEQIRSRINEFRHNDRFGIPVVIDENCKSATLLGHLKIKKLKIRIKKITIHEKWRESSTILKRTPYATSASAWLEYMGGTSVSIELTDGTKLRGQIEPRLKEEREKIIKLEDAQEVSKAKGNVKRLRPYEKKIRARDQRLKSQSSAAANTKRCIVPARGNTPARYTYTDAEIIAKVTEYKRQHPRDMLSTMLNYIRIKHEGRPYLNYSDPEKLRRRLEKTFAPKTPKQGYHALK